MRYASAFAVPFLLAPLFALAGAIAHLVPVADTTLTQNYPSNNLGAVTFCNAGTTQNHTRNRALLRFDLPAAVPEGARILSADLILEVVGEPSEPPESSDFGLRRVLRPWGEGNKVSPANCGSCRGQGSPATAGEATWLSRFAQSTNSWAEPGGTAGIDFAEEMSSATTIYGVGNSPYVFASTPRMIADVQAWIDAPEQNYGWVLASVAEEAALTARRFGAREDPVNTPILRIAYVIQPRLQVAELTGGAFAFQFRALPGHTYEVQRLPLREQSWSTFTNLAAPAEPTVIKVTAPNLEKACLYRLRVW